MDERQSQITEGAGLDDSRVNEEFVDFLRKWATPALLVLAIAAFSYAGLTRLQASKIATVDDAFVSYEAARGLSNPSPDSLKQVATSYASIRSIAPMALLDTAGLYLRAARTGLRPGSSLLPDGSAADETDLLTQDEVTAHLDQSIDLYQQVLGITASNTDRASLTISAHFGIAAVQASKGEADAARAAYAQAETLSNDAGFVTLAKLANLWSTRVSDSTDLPHLFSQDDFPKLPTEIAAEEAEALRELLNPANDFFDPTPTDDIVGPVIPPADDSSDDSSDDPAETPADDAAEDDPATNPEETPAEDAPAEVPATDPATDSADESETPEPADSGDADTEPPSP